MRGVLANRLRMAETLNFAAQGQSGSRKTVAEVPLNGLSLSGNNTYSGATTVSAGKLVINGNQSAATGVVTVAAGAALGGSGTVGGATTIAGSHTPGNSPGVQTFASDLAHQVLVRQRAAARRKPICGSEQIDKLLRR